MKFNDDRFSMATFFLLLNWLVPSGAFAQTADVKIKDVSTAENTAIFIEKNAERVQSRTPREYEIVDGSEEIIGDPSNDEAVARKSWKAACNEWRNTMKELNKGTILALNCGRPKKEKESYNISFESVGVYKLRVRIRDEVAPKKK